MADGAALLVHYQSTFKHPIASTFCGQRRDGESLVYFENVIYGRPVAPSLPQPTSRRRRTWPPFSLAREVYNSVLMVVGFCRRRRRCLSLSSPLSPSPSLLPSSCGFFVSAVFTSILSRRNGAAPKKVEPTRGVTISFTRNLAPYSPKI